MKLPLYTIEGKKKGSVAVPDELFAVSVHPDLLHQSVVTARANLRIPLAHVKDRSEVRGGGRKPWRQKGTGQARHGSIRSPLWRGGGVTFGPSNRRVFSKDLPKKMRRKALFGALSSKASEGNVSVVESFSFPEIKTSSGAALLAALSLKCPRVLLWGNADDKEFSRVFRNIPRVTARKIDNIAILDILNHAHILFSRSALQTLMNTYGSPKLVQQKEKEAVSTQVVEKARRPEGGKAE